MMLNLKNKSKQVLFKKYNQKQNVNSHKNINNVNNTNDTHRETKTQKSDGQKNKSAEAADFNERMKKHKVGSFGGIVELCKELYKNKPKRDEMKEVTKKDVIALVLTVIVVVLIWSGFMVYPIY